MSLTRDQLTNLFKGVTKLTRKSTLTLDDISAVRMIVSAAGAGGLVGALLDPVESALRGGADINDDKQMTLDEFVDYAEQHQV